MAIDFDKFDKTVNLEGLQKDIESASENGGDFPEIPKGTYEVKPHAMEIKLTKKEPKRPMFAAQFKILSGEYKGQLLFMNRVIYGTKNDGSMIKSVLGFLKKMEAPDVVIAFDNYSQFSDLVLDVQEAVDGALEYAVDYDPDAFNSISIKEVFDVE
ncbi:MAG: DUF669 domain-containing protein [Alphaproteobacteria bacterium]|nr:DUF669 domain-containing protein [Alphaproteobacteria bacterium]